MPFEMEGVKTPVGERKREVAYLNEPQTTLLLTYMKNTEKIRHFKKALVKAFYKAVNYIRHKNDSEFFGKEDGLLSDASVKKTGNMYFPMAKLKEELHSKQ